MTQEQFIVYILAPVAGYLLASIPFAFLIGKANGVDIRTVGSKNIGATNLGRALGPRFFWYAFFPDIAKGFVPVLAVALFVHRAAETGAGWTFYTPYSTESPLPSWAPLLSAIACVLGHTFPIYLKFKGGKGVATSFGVVLGFWPLFTLAGIGAGLTFLVTLLIYRYISLASIVGSVALVALVALLGTQTGWFTYMPWNQLWPLLGVASLFASLIIFRHRGNISRLLKGTEPKINSPKPRPPTA